MKSVEQQKQRAGFMKTVLNHAYEGIVSVDEKGIISSINPIAQRILYVKEDKRQSISSVWPELELEKY